MSSNIPMSIWIGLTVAIVVATYVLRRVRFDWGVVAIAIAGSALSANYLSYTTIGERNYDGSSHVEYVQFIAQHWRLPSSTWCAMCGHPPLYYGLAALWSKALPTSVPLELGLQWFSLLLFFGFIVLSLLVLRSSTQNPISLWLGALLVTFWPLSVINSVRVHNDALASVLTLAAIYWTAEWDRNDRARDFQLALGSSALALCTKSSGYAACATLLLFTFLRLWSKREPLRSSLQRCVLAIVGLTLPAVLLAQARSSGEPRLFCHHVLGPACRGRYVPPIPDSLDRFLSFDLFSFICRIDTAAADTFPNRFLKSVLFGVMPLGDDFSGQLFLALRAILSLLFLVMIAICVIGLLGLDRSSLRRYRVYLASALLSFGLLVAFRLRLPNEFHEDFRHIYPVLVPVCVAYTKLVERWHRTTRWIANSATVVGVLFAATSIAFFLRVP